MSSCHNVIRPACRVSQYLMLGVVLASPLAVGAQKPVGAGTGSTSVPDSPQPKPQASSNPIGDTTARFIGYVSNRSIVFPDIASSQGALTSGEKFKLFVNQSISPPYLIAAGLSSASSQARNVPEAYGQGWDAYGSRYGAALARAASNSFFNTFVLSSALHQDPRFYPQHRPSFWGSVKYSAKRLVITRSDAGNEVINTSGLLGTLLAEGLANAYLPASEQTIGKTFERYASDTGWRFAGNMFKNYWPTIFQQLGLNRLKVIPNPGSPDSPASTTPK